MRTRKSEVAGEETQTAVPFKGAAPGLVKLPVVPPTDQLIAIQPTTAVRARTEQVGEKNLTAAAEPQILPPPTTAAGPNNQNSTATPNSSSAASPQSALHQAIDNVSKLRDGVFILGSVCIFIGILIMETNAIRMNLGFVAASPTQYVFAGAFPGLLLAIGLLAWQAGVVWAVQLARYLAALHQKRRPFVTIGSASLLTGLYYLVANVWSVSANHRLWPASECLLAEIALPYLFGILLAAGYMVPSPDAKNPGHATDPQSIGTGRGLAAARVIVVTMPLLFFFILLHFYGSTFYPALPQEFGGMHPRMAYMDVTRLQLSPETRSALLPANLPLMQADPSKDRAPVVRTILLDVVWDAGDIYLVRPHGSRVTPTYRIRKDLVQSVTWYGYRQP